MEEKNNGYCPYCSMEKKNNPFRINMNDYWECPECHLQAQLIQGPTEPVLGILPMKGEGNFKEGGISNPHSYIVNLTMVRKPNGSDKVSFEECIIQNKEDLLAYILENPNMWK
jgi:hypothetical protein